MKQLLHKLFLRWVPNKLLAVLTLVFIPLTALNFFIPDPVPFIDEALLSLWSWSLIKETERRMRKRLAERQEAPATDPPPWDGVERRRAQRVRIEIPVHLADESALSESRSVDNS